MCRPFVHRLGRRHEAPTKHLSLGARLAAPPQPPDPVDLPGAPGRTRTCDARFRKQENGTPSRSLAVLGAPNLTKWGKAWLYQAAEKRNEKSDHI